MYLKKELKIEIIRHLYNCYLESKHKKKELKKDYEKLEESSNQKVKNNGFKYMSYDRIGKECEELIYKLDKDQQFKTRKLFEDS